MCRNPHGLGGTGREGRNAPGLASPLPGNRGKTAKASTPTNWIPNCPKVMNTLREATMTGEIGDGKIVVLAVEEAMRIRTGETGEASIS